MLTTFSTHSILFESVWTLLLLTKWLGLISKLLPRSTTSTVVFKYSFSLHALDSKSSPISPSGALYKMFSSCSHASQDEQFSIVYQIGHLFTCLHQYFNIISPFFQTSTWPSSASLPFLTSSIEKLATHSSVLGNWNIFPVDT